MTLMFMHISLSARVGGRTRSEDMGKRASVPQERGLVGGKGQRRIKGTLINTLWLQTHARAACSS